MNVQEFRAMHQTHKSCFKKQFEVNPVNSNTDPTQDVPIEKIELIAGMPVNVKKQNMAFTNAGVDKLSSIDRRNFDKFDAVGELQAAEQRAKSVKPQKQVKQ